MKTLEQYLSECRESTVWQEGNQTLYDLCQKYPDHTDSGQIVAKTWLVGRAYSVALERRRGASESNEVYYRNVIPRVFKSSQLDEWLLSLPKDKVLTADWLPEVLDVHSKLVAHLRANLGRNDGAEGLTRESFCSKYLHFHRPLLFPIIDSRAVKGLRLLLNDYLPDLKLKLGYPAKYKLFAEAILVVLTYPNTRPVEPLNLRHIDNLLLMLAENERE